MVSSGRKAIFLDRDGVLTVPEFRDGRSFAPRRLEDFQLYETASACLGRLKGAGFLLVVVTNQPDVGNGFVSRDVVEEMHRRLAEALPVDTIEVCFHRREDHCSCRKPLPGMLLHAAERLGIDCTQSIMIGDRGTDVAAGKAVGCRTIFIDLGYLNEEPSTADHVVGSLQEATDIILGA